MTIAEWLADEGEGGTLLLAGLGWLLAVGQFLWNEKERRSRARQEERVRREERFRDERLGAYSVFVAAAWATLYDLDALQRGADLPPVEPNDVWRRMTPLAGPIHMLGPDDIGSKAQGVIAALFNLAFAVSNGEPDRALLSTSAREILLGLEHAARADLGVTTPEAAPRR